MWFGPSRGTEGTYSQLLAELKHLDLRGSSGFSGDAPTMCQRGLSEGIRGRGRECEGIASNASNQKVFGWAGQIAETRTFAT